MGSKLIRRIVLFLCSFGNLRVLAQTTIRGSTISTTTTDISPTNGGPNVCRSGYRNYCCPGWKLKPGTNLCVSPFCWRHCGDGSCIKPNLCMCENGAIGTTCNRKIPTTNQLPADGNSTTSCSFRCMNGGSCSTGGKCVCKPGFAGEYCTEPICKEGCLNGGRCIGPDRCACVYGYAGKKCEADYRVGPCFRKVVNDMCQSQLLNVVCTKQLCCATIGRAWGHPCEHCPLQLDCSGGFIKNIHSGQCVDIDECEAIPGLCEGGTCVNTLGSFQCTCPEGKVRNALTNACEDENECKMGSKDVCQHGKCVNSDGSYYCICDTGYIPTLDKKHCLDARQGKCYVRVNEKNQCVESLPIKLSKMDCCCGKNMGKAWGDGCDLCPNSTNAEYAALCLSGSGGGRNDTSGMSLTQVDECALRAGICGGGRCIDTADGFVCECYTGYAKKKNVDVQVCEDIDECEQDLCKGGRCINSAGSYACSCPVGFDVSSDGRQCIDHDECQEKGMCANGMCINMDGSFKCRCNAGFISSSAGHACVDVDECYENPRICLNGRCINTAGSYRCECQSGFTPTSDDGFCVDINECQIVSNVCENGRCINSEGSFRCVCNVGYRLNVDKKSCIDIDECVNSVCQNGKCVNTMGSFRCECPPGFYLGADGQTCLDSTIDLCYAEYNDGQCTKPSQTPVSKSSCCCFASEHRMAWGTPCAPCPLPGTVGHTQLCPHGSGMTFTGDDINECAQSPFVCENGACENQMGTYRCICNIGYEPNVTGKSCVDINECEKDESVCTGGLCKNTPGDFQCICPTGTSFNLSNSICEDVDECTVLGTNACSNGKCVNTFGSFNCECPPNSILDNTGRVCLDNRRGSCWTKYVNGRCENNLPKVTLKTECCCSVGQAWGSPCEQCNLQECNCTKGYAKIDGKMCSDINECEVNAGVCRGGGTCVNTDGSFICVCPSGLTLDRTGTICEDTRMDTCYTDYKFSVGMAPVDGAFQKSTCCCSTIGKAWASEPCPRPNTPAFNDLCPKGPGYVERKDINECLEFASICTNGRCKNTMGGFTCTCNAGFTHNDNGLKCVDIDECSIMYGVCGEHGECKNIAGSFECKCRDGYESHPMMRVCVDIDECERNASLCKGGNCVNDVGSYHCTCPDGHELSADKQYCKDVDECSRTSGICSNGICENLMGTYQCICDYGFLQMDGKSHCVDINECDHENGGCVDICVNTPGSYHCDCKSGYVLTADGRNCTDLDECVENARICNGGECVNIVGGYSCLCGSGLTYGVENSTCVDINECDTNNTNICGNGECVNNVGSYACKCEDGYSIKYEDNPFCADEDECALDTDVCDKNAICVNNPGSYSCRCLDGFVGNGISCSDINECLTNNGGCHKNAQCVNTDGSFNCVCDEGFTGDGYLCNDVDECVENRSTCENGRCINYPGSYRCECAMGFTNPDDKNNQKCIDIDECQAFDNLCVFGRCENHMGMFKCECNVGYQVDSTGGNCTDINECDSPQACLYGNCTNTEGSFTCKCPPNFQLTASGNGCVDRRESRCYTKVEEKSGKRRCSQEVGSPVTKATCCCSLGTAWGGRCELCPATDSEEFKQLCPGGIGYRPNTTTVVLEDINECDEHENMCKNGHCTNTFGSYMCICNEGFRLDNSSAFCNDIDECGEKSEICGVGFCINDQGSYHCICPDGYMVMPNGKECIDTRKEECYLNYTRNMCSEPMSGPQTKMICCCSMGQAWGHPCRPCPSPSSKEYVQLCGTKPGQVKNPVTNATEEIDECALMPQMCNHGKCVNTLGSFHCLCDPGYVYDQVSHQCIDENECLRVPSPCRGNSRCVNNLGRFECKCPKGYKLGANMNDCVDIDECFELENACKNGECANLEGSFQCTCKNGYILNSQRDGCVDLNECQRNPNICNNGTCVNTNGTYKCLCHDGFKLSHNNDCADIDECATMPHLCRNGRCKNTLGSFKCECADGYTLTNDGHHCKDIDECREQGGNCPSPGRCQNVMGSFFCICPTGYRLVSNRTRCEDIDECVENSATICTNGKCINTEGSAYCECPAGFVTSPNGMECIDLRQEQCYNDFKAGLCSNPRNQNLTAKECCCSMGAAWGRLCEQCPSSDSAEFAKLCPMGIGHGDQGEDLNECLLIPNVCQGGECINTDGSYRCECPAGFILDATGTICIDFDECVASTNICGNGSCTNLVGSFECTCGAGFAPGPMQTCEDVNECLDATNQCAFRCHNTLGSYRCVCPYGYSTAEDGHHCQDVDECSTAANNCKYKCKNLIGSFACVCPDGYTKVGSTDECVDTNECVDNRNPCENGRCVNLAGSYRCDCLDGFRASADGKRCLDERTGNCYRNLTNGRCVNSHNVASKPIRRVDCCCTIGVAWGPMCLHCPSPNTPEYRHQCGSSGFNVDGLDIDECSTMPELCENGACVNTIGSYRCSCNRGYKIDSSGMKCIDINECALSPSPCQSICENTDGGFSCSCAHGFTLSRDNSTCRDVDECATGSHTCQQNCVNTNGSYECVCNRGYKQIGDRCVDIDECSRDGVCPPPGTCINSVGSYRCVCPKGHKLDPTGTYCVNLADCPDGNCGFNCDNSNSPRCKNVTTNLCPEGFTKRPYYNECMDKNECLLSPCGTNQCINTVGSYQCICPDGYIFDDGVSSCVQMKEACVNSSCSFGCTPVGAVNYICGCPYGYQPIGQGHCLSTINSGVDYQSVPNLGADIPTYPINAGTEDGIISTEGCFSCKINDKGGFVRHKRNLANSTSTQRENFVQMVNKSYEGESARVEMTMSYEQVRMKAFVLSLQPVMKEDKVQYELMDDRDSNQFQVQNEDDVRIVYFKRKPDQERKNFRIGILAKKLDENPKGRREIFRLYVKLTIVP